MFICFENNQILRSKKRNRKTKTKKRQLVSLGRGPTYRGRALSGVQHTGTTADPYSPLIAGGIWLAAYPSPTGLA
jgi:hypothetical protein